MVYSLVQTIRLLWAPQHKLACSWFMWRRLLAGLRERGLNSTRESGAFLLGHEHHGRARIVGFVLYDDLDPNCLKTGIVRFDGRHFGKLWKLCQKWGVSVVADVHVHPGSSQQSELDKAYPMISRAGHLAIILPNFAAPPVQRLEMGIYRYEGAKRWHAIPVRDRQAFFYIGL